MRMAAALKKVQISAMLLYSISIGVRISWLRAMNIYRRFQIAAKVMAVNQKIASLSFQLRSFTVDILLATQSARRRHGSSRI